MKNKSFIIFLGMVLGFILGTTFFSNATYSPAFWQNRPKRFVSATVNLTVGGGTSRTVTLPFTVTNAAYDVVLTPGADFGSVRYWVSPTNKTATNFIISLSSAITAPIEVAGFER